MENGKIRLTPVEQRYIASCSPLPDRIFYDEAIKWKEIMRKSAIDDKLMEVPVIELTKPFPNITRLYFQGLFKNRSVQSYFEGIDSQAHNLRMYSFAKKIERNGFLQNMVPDVLAHVELCSVKVADLVESRVWSYTGIYRGGDNNFLIDTDYLKVHPITDYVFVHGKSEKGLIAVRSAKEHEVEIMKEWFERRQRSSKNPFFRHDSKLK